MSSNWASTIPRASLERGLSGSSSAARARCSAASLALPSRCSSNERLKIASARSGDVLTTRSSNRRAPRVSPLFRRAALSAYMAGTRLGSEIRASWYEESASLGRPDLSSASPRWKWASAKFGSIATAASNWSSASASLPCWAWMMPIARRERLSAGSVSTAARNCPRAACGVPSWRYRKPSSRCFVAAALGSAIWASSTPPRATAANASAIVLQAALTARTVGALRKPDTSETSRNAPRD